MTIADPAGGLVRRRAAPTDRSTAGAARTGLSRHGNDVSERPVVRAADCPEGHPARPGVERRTRRKRTGGAACRARTLGSRVHCQ
ncbi:hypothetical protein GCM10009663_18400 [Kitasatospora arboriphila]|uniref:Transposase IS701-like DDE domain-containing protein n=1 Tax=Kitasatospora arboriphila TaxID=258052 RepID=A0ABP4E0F5_9ACTN